MNLQETTLVRGWINHLDWSELADVSGEGGATPQRFSKQLRQQLALKARFYEKPEWEVLWLSKRFPIASWIEKADHSFKVLNQLPDPKPALHHSIGKWFSAVCQAFTAEMKTLADVMDSLDRYYAGSGETSADFTLTLPSLIRFFEQHEPALGRALIRRPMALRDPEAIIERLTVIRTPEISTSDNTIDSAS